MSIDIKKFLVISFLLFGCSRYKTLNLQDYSFSEIPSKIVWIQVAGLDLEHIGLLKYKLSIASKSLAMENFYCMGKLWSHNLFKLRPEPRDGFLTQITGSKNIKNSCEDFSKKPFWDYFPAGNLQVYALENQVPDNASYENYFKCSEGEDYKKILSVFRMQMNDDKEGKSLFHYQYDFPIHKETVSFDRSCNSEQCFANLYNNFSILWENFKSSKLEKVFLIRDFSFYNALKAKDIKKAESALSDLEQVLKLILRDRTEKMVIMLTGSGTQKIEFPAQGSEWKDFYNKGKNILYKHSSVQSPLLSYGAYSHHLCGMYDESEVKSRLLLPFEKKSFFEKIFSF